MPLVRQSTGSVRLQRQTERIEGGIATFSHHDVRYLFARGRLGTQHTYLGQMLNTGRLLRFTLAEDLEALKDG